MVTLCCYQVCRQSQLPFATGFGWMVKPHYYLQMQLKVTWRTAVTMLNGRADESQ